MLKKLMTLIMSAIMMISSAYIPAMAETASTPQPLVEEVVFKVMKNGVESEITEEELVDTTGYVSAAVKVNNPGAAGASSVKLVVACINKTTGNPEKINSDIKSVTAATTNVILSAGVDYDSNLYKFDYFVLDQDGASLLNTAPMPVEEIRYSAKIKYVRLEWDVPGDDFSSVKEYIITRDGVEIGRTDRTEYIDPADGERDNVTLTYGVTAVDHGGLKSEETFVTLTTPAFATACLRPTEEETAELSSGIKFNFIDYRLSDIYNIGFSTEGGVKNGVKYRNTVSYIQNGTDVSTIMMFNVDSQIIKDDDQNITLEITYLDEGTHGIRFQYYKPNQRDPSTPIYANDKVVTFSNSREWKTAKIVIKEFLRSGGEGKKGFGSPCSFRMTSDDRTKKIFVSKVRMISTDSLGNDIKDLLNPQDPTQGAFVIFGENEDKDRENCMDVYYTEWNEANPTEQQSSREFYNGEWCRKTYEFIANDGSVRKTNLTFKIDSSVLGDNDNHVRISVKFFNDGTTPIRMKYFKPGGTQKQAVIASDASRPNQWITKTIELEDFSIADADIPSGWKAIGQFNMFSDAATGSNKSIYVASVKVEKIGATTPEPPTEPEEPTSPEEDPALGAWVTFGDTKANDTSNCMNFYYADWNESAPSEQQSTLMQYNGEWCRRTYEYQTGTTQRRTYLNYTIGSAVLPERDNHVKISIRHYNDGTPIKVKYFKPDASKSSKQINVMPDASTLNSWTTTVVEIENFSIADEDVSDGWKPIGQFNISSNATWGEGKVLYVSSVKLEKVDAEEPTQTELTVFMAGDSIAQYQPDSAYPKSGWFQHLSKFFDSSVNLDNRALGGMSARSFRERKVNSAGKEDANGTAPWTSLLADAKEGDYVLISFAHNDSVTSKTADYTDPTLSMDAEFGENGKASYKYYLKKYVEEARAKGVNPIFVTAVESHQTNGDYDPPQFKSYADAMIAVGTALDVPVLNINEEICKLYNSYGAINDKVFFRLISATDLGTKPMSDGVHLRDYGALHVANLVRTLLKDSSCELKNRLLEKYTQPASVFVNDRFRTDITPVEREGKYLVPAVKVLEGIDATEIVSNETSFSAKVKIPSNDSAQGAVYSEEVIEAAVGSVNYTVGGATITKDYAPEMINGSIYINPVFFEDICGGNVYYNEFMKMTTILTGINTSALPFSETFDNFVGSETADIYPAGWESAYFVANQSYMVGEITPGSNNEAIKLVRKDADVSLPYYLIHDFEYVSSQTFTMRVKTSDVTTRKDIKLWVNETGNGSVFITAAKLANGKITGPASTTINPQPLTANTWVTLKFIVVIVDDANHVTTNMFTYVVDENGEDIFVGNYEVPASTGMIEGIRVELYGENDVLYIDDLEVNAYTGGFPAIPQPEEPAGDPTLGAWVTFGATQADDVTNCMEYSYDTTVANPSSSTTFNEKTCIKMPHKHDGTNRNYIYFAVDTAVMESGSNANIILTYYDAGISPRLEYYNTDGTFKNPVIDSNPTNSGWKTVTLSLEDFSLTHAPGGWPGQFRIRSNSGSTPATDAIYIADIKLEKVDADDPTLGAWVEFGETAAEDDTNCMKYSYDTTDSNCCTSTTYSEKACLKMPHFNSAGSRNYIYFTLNPEVLGESSKVNLTLTYYDAGISPRIEYYNASNEFKNPVIDASPNSSGWKTVILTLEDLPFTDRSGWPGQFRIRSNSGASPATDSIYIAGVKVEKVAVPQIWMAGDSLSAIYRDNQRPQTGWMEVFASEYAQDITVQNKAIGGESSKSYYDRGYLDTILNNAKEGDYLFIQFSHNDTHTGVDNEYRHTDPGNWSDETKTEWVPSTYENQMSLYITKAREKGLNPVILTSVAWAYYTNGEFSGRTYRNMERYAQGAKYVAAKYNVPLIDVFEPTCKYHETAASPDAYKEYYMHIDACSAANDDECVNKARHADWNHAWCANFPTGRVDDVHLNWKGAAWVAQIVADGLFELNLPITEMLKATPDA